MTDTYSLRAFGAMIADSDRFSAYAEAIARAVRPSDVVLEIGCGPAVFALLACCDKARRVFAVDTADIVDFARQLAAANGLAHRIEFFQCDARKLTLPERANIIVSDIRGALPFHSYAIPTIEDARQRHLAPGGTLIPQRDTAKAALVEAPDFYSSLTSPWQQEARNLDLSAALSLILNDHHGSQFKPEQLLSDPQTFCVLDYARGTADSAKADLSFVATRSGTAHGICLWFETNLFADIGYSTGPGAANSVYSQLILPWPQPVPFRLGQQVQVTLSANLVGADYVWRWETFVSSQVHFQQSNFYGARFSPGHLRTHAVDFTPSLSEEGQADLYLLQQMNGHTPLQQIAASAHERFPPVFATPAEALDRTAALAEKYSC